MLKPETVSGAVPVFVRFAVWTVLVVLIRWAGKVMLETLKLAAGAVPVPESVAGGIAILVLLFTVIVPLRAPVAVGVNVTVIVQ